MKKYTFSLLAAVFFITQFAKAQQRDAQLWENIGLEKNITPRLIARVVQEGRLTENYTRPSYNYFDMGFSYKLNKHFHFSLAYVWAEKKVVTDFWMPRSQAYATLTFRQKMGNFTFNDRQMLQWQVKDTHKAPDGGVPEYYLRNKATIRFDRSFKWAPYIAAELYYKANSPEQYVRYRFDRVRFFAGLFYRLDKENEFEVYYMYEDNFNQKHLHENYVLGLGYTHSF